MAPPQNGEASGQPSAAANGAKPAARPLPALPLYQVLKAATGMDKATLDGGLLAALKDMKARGTLEIVLKIMNQEQVTKHRSWRLNERMYGGLTALDKKATVEKYGTDQVQLWRRSYDIPPPPVDESSEYFPGNDNRYAHLPDADIPRSECLKDCVERTMPFWDSAIVPALDKGKTVLVAAHGNSIRGMVKMLDDISDDDITGLEIPTGVPLLYTLDAKLRPIPDPRAAGLLTGAFLGDPAEIAAAQEKVAAQTKVAA